MKRFLVWLLPLVLAAAMARSPAAAQNTLGIVAIVNDRPISAYDMQMRMGLVMLFSGVPDTAENRQRLAPQVLRSLIDDELKRQEAKRRGVTVSDAEIADHIHRLERLNKLEQGRLKALLEAKNIDWAALKSQVAADLGWSKLIGDLYARRFSISDEDIDEEIAQIERNKGKPEYRVSEIFLPVDRPEAAPEALALARKLIQQLQSGASFAALARNFSKSPTARIGGDLGWNTAVQLGGELSSVIANMQPGQVSQPIRTSEGYTIVLYRDRRIAQGLEAADEAGSMTVNLQQFFLPIEKNATLTEISQTMQAIRKVGQKVKNCKDMEEAAKVVDSPLSGNLGDIALESLAPQRRALIRNLPTMVVSEPLRTDDGVLILMVCRRDEAERKTISMEARRDQIANKLFNERLGRAARQHLSDLRRAAFLDIRL